MHTLKFCTKHLNGNYALKIFEDLFPKDLLVRICSGDVLQQVASRNIFGIRIIISQHIFYEAFWEIFQKRFWKYNDSREMLQKNPIDFL